MKWAIIEYHQKLLRMPHVILFDACGKPFASRDVAAKFAVESVEPSQDHGWDWDVAMVEEPFTAYNEHAKARPAHPLTMIGKIG
jgi:hypothetical protein